MGAYFTLNTETGGNTQSLRMEGAWTVSTLAAIDSKLPDPVLIRAPQLTLNGQELDDFDTSAAWYLRHLQSRMRERGIQVSMAGFSKNHLRIYDRVAALPDEHAARRKMPGFFAGIFIWLGSLLMSMLRGLKGAVTFLGQMSAYLIETLTFMRRLRLRSIIYHINEVGVRAVPIIALMAFSISIVTGYQGAIQLEKFGATIFTVDLIVLSTLREMSVLLAAIMLAGRSGSAFAAQIGTMKLNEEVDALQTMGVSTFEVLVLPRIIAIVIALPLLTFIADLAGIAGAYIFTSWFMDMSYLQFFSRLQDSAELTHLFVGLYKAPVFALLIGMVGCMQGLLVKNSAEQVGRRTTSAVVQSIFLVIVCDALFSILFTKLGI